MDKNIRKQEILNRRKEIESEIVDLLAEASSHFSLEDIKSAVYEEEETDDITHIIAMFDTGEANGPEPSTVLEVVTDAWNYFPHKTLGGLSPEEKSLER